MTKEIFLAKRFHALVDDADYEQVMAAGRWRISVCGDLVYAGRSIKTEYGTWRTERMHTFLTGWSLVDHVNGDGLDNRRANLRPANGSQNNANNSLSDRNHTGFRGVSFFKRTGRWRAFITFESRQRHLGYFATAEEAARAYDDAARELFGEFARPNFPLEKNR